MFYHVAMFLVIYWPLSGPHIYFENKQTLTSKIVRKSEELGMTENQNTHKCLSKLAKCKYRSYVSQNNI